MRQTVSGFEAVLLISALFGCTHPTSTPCPSGFPEEAVDGALPSLRSQKESGLGSAPSDCGDGCCCKGSASFAIFPRAVCEADDRLIVGSSIVLLLLDIEIDFGVEVEHVCSFRILCS